MSWSTWSEPFEPSEPGVLLVCIVRRGPDMLIDGRRSWLTSAEAARVATIGTRERQQEWLAGRLTAKYAVWLTASDVRPRLSPWQIEILANAQGRPRAYLRRAGQPALTADLSLAHCPGAIACATPGVGRPGAVGVDVELASPMILEVVERFTRPEERRCLARSSLPEVFATILWGLKEAAVKCLGGWVSRRRAFEVSLDEEHSRARVVLRERVESVGEVPSLCGGFRTVGQHVVTWVSSPDRPVRLNVLGEGRSRGPTPETRRVAAPGIWRRLELGLQVRGPGVRAPGVRAVNGPEMKERSREEELAPR